MSKRALEEDSNTAAGSTALGWQKCFSKRYGTEYWFNTLNGKKSWEDPSVTSAGKEAEAVGGQKESKRLRAPMATNGAPRTKVAIVVPFRDLHAEQKRGNQLRQFFPFMTEYLTSAGAVFHIYIVEQSDDNRKFNRGKLLNIGYDLAKKDGCSVFIFHDVDLLPSVELKGYYTQRPEEHPVHIARVWSRYSGNPKYFGGVVSFSDDMFSRINGFPNNFWGWGGEDDEMYKRTIKVRSAEARIQSASPFPLPLQRAHPLHPFHFRDLFSPTRRQIKLTPTAPTAGSLTDMEKTDQGEDMGIKEKLAFLRANQGVLKCMNKTEVLQEHEATWKKNGLFDLHYTEISREALNDACTKVTVDVGLNGGHWTDDRSGIKDSQRNP
jgi:hypothetical protein